MPAIGLGIGVAFSLRRVGITDQAAIISVINYITGQSDITYISALNTLVVQLGGSAQESVIDAINAIGVSQDPGWETITNNIMALNAICTSLGGERGHTGAHGELQAWQEIQGIGLGLSPATRSKFLFLWTGKFSGNNLLSDLDELILHVTGRDFPTNYIPATSTATFAIPNTDQFKNADIDNFWHSGATILQKTTAELVASDITRSIVKYSDIEPYHIWAIGILKPGETIDANEYDALSKYFWLHWLYFGATNDYGHLKDNRNT